MSRLLPLAVAVLQKGADGRGADGGIVDAATKFRNRGSRHGLQRLLAARVEAYSLTATRG